MTMQFKAPLGAGALILGTVALLGGLAGPRPGLDGAAAQRREPPPSREAAQYSFAPIVKTAAPAVVNVYVSSRVKTFVSPFANDPVFGRLFGEQFGFPAERVQNSLGSGVIVSADGIVVTNTHVVKGGGETEIRVALADKREFDAKVLVQDEKTDIAILKIENGGAPFQVLEFADSDGLEVGDLVLAIGNPFGVGQTVTSGIISALARTEMGRSDTQVFVQTDAAINPGNSGGALVDMAGKLVGINTMIFSQSGGSHGIGFAIPSNLVRVYVQSAEEGRAVERPWLGARLEGVTRDTAAGLGLDRATGALVARVWDKGPAAAAGLEAGDVIVGIDDFEIADARSVNYRLTTLGVGKTVRLAILRGGKPMTIEITLQAPPEPGRNDVRNLTGQHPLDGARVSNILPAVADEYGLDDTDGVVVLSLRAGSVAQLRGFRSGDVLVAVQQQPVKTVAELEEAFSRRQRVWLIDVRRGDKLLQLRVSG